MKVYLDKLVKNSNADKSVFWLFLYVNAGVWIFYTIYEVITLKFIWFVISFICMTFAVVNLYGFFNCSKEQQGRLKNLAAQGVMKAMDKGLENKDVLKN
jgi:hypothetical protein